MQPTAEQQQIIDAATTGGNLVIEAGAGTGKTSTLRLLADAKPGQRGLYIAYNKAIATEAAAKFPASVNCRTAHSLAFRSHGSQYTHRLNGPRVPAREVAKILKVEGPTNVGGRTLQPKQQARLAIDTVTQFCYSAAETITPKHVPWVAGISDAEPEGDIHPHAALQELITPYALKAWADILDQGGRLKFAHDHYLKMWQLAIARRGTVLPYDYILFDEAQDANPVIADVVWRQPAQRLLVGDRNQAIYGWRGAIDAMQHFDGQRLYLSQSFRFGPAISDAANQWLELLGAELRLSGFDAIKSTVGPVAAPPDAILCRSNAGAIEQVMNAVGALRHPALVGGGGDVKRLAQAAESLMDGRGTDHPELMAFQTWEEVQDYADDDDGGDLKVLVRIVDTYGTAAIIKLCDNLTDEANADVVISTAHKAKGREWPAVRIADDFREPDTLAGLPREEMMLAYVAITRAQQHLDPHGLTWVDRLTAEHQNAHSLAGVA